jgi:DNA-directed DNA polymerase III PolC
MKRVLLNAKSYFSLMWGVRSPAEVVRKAAELGHEAVALADRDGLYGLPEFLDEAKRQRIRAIVAAEVTDPATSQSALLYPTSKEGYANLCRILTERRRCSTGVSPVGSSVGHAIESVNQREQPQWEQPPSALKGPNRIARGVAPGVGCPRNYEALKGRDSRSFAPSGLEGDCGVAHRGLRPRLLSPAPSGQNGCSTLKRRRQDACGTARTIGRQSQFSLERLLDQHSNGLAIVTDSLGIIRRFSGRACVYFRMEHSLRRSPTAAEGPQSKIQNLKSKIRDAARAIAPPAIFFDHDDYDLHRLLRAIDLKQRLSSIPPEQLADERDVFEPWDKIASRFAAMPEVIEGTERLLDELRFDADFSEIVFPEFPCPPDMSVIELLRCKVYEGAKRRYAANFGFSILDFGLKTADAPGARIPSRTVSSGNPFPQTSQDRNPGGSGCEIGISHQKAPSRGSPPQSKIQNPKSKILPPAVIERIERELDLIEQKGFAPYFLVVDEIVRQSPRTCGRGSAAASIVSYCLGITNVDPIRHNLMFERFLNPGRTDPPDIDVDFAWDERDDILDWVFKTYGHQRSAMVANHIRFRPRMALRETARVFGIPEREISQVTGRLPWFWQTDDIEDLDRIVRTAPRMAGVDLDPPWPEIIRLAGRLIDMPRGLSVHCGGVVLTPGPIWERAPIQPAAKGVNIIHWDKEGVEEMGLVKIDVLGNRSLAVIRDAIANIKAEGVPFDETRWRPIEDAKTQALLASGRTMGVFYVESPAMRQLQIKTGRGDFDHMVINTSIIRPAANAYTQEYVKRVHGQPYKPIHPLLKDLLAETYGIMVYQEDVSRVAMALAGFSCEQADRLRKIMSKKDKHLELAHFYRMFVEGAKAKGISDAVIEEVWRMILAFSGYSFCKPHSASYTMVSYESAYLKAHHPAEFMAAVMGNHGGYYSTQAYVSEARRWGIEILPPDINLSEQKFYAKQEKIVTGLAEIKGLSLAAQDRILKERALNGPFSNLGDFLARTRITHADAKQLILVGAFDRIEPDKNRPTLLWELKVTVGGVSDADRSDFGFSILDFGFHAADAPALCNPKSKIQNLKSVRLPDYNQDRKLRLEYELLSFLTAVHPLDVFAQYVELKDFVKADSLGKYVGRTVRVLSWPVSSKTISTTTGEDMEFVSFEDQTDIYEAVLFPREYRRYVHLLAGDAPVIVTGKVDRNFGAISVIVTHIAPA